jgi:hypothetical protein
LGGSACHVLPLVAPVLERRTSVRRVMGIRWRLTGSVWTSVPRGMSRSTEPVLLFARTAVQMSFSTTHSATPSVTWTPATAIIPCATKTTRRTVALVSIGTSQNVSLASTPVSTARLRRSAPHVYNTRTRSTNSCSTTASVWTCAQMVRCRAGLPVSPATTTVRRVRTLRTPVRPAKTTSCCTRVSDRPGAM